VHAQLPEERKGLPLCVDSTQLVKEIQNEREREKYSVEKKNGRINQAIELWNVYWRVVCTVTMT
jgi:hypothetical protein